MQSWWLALIFIFMPWQFSSPKEFDPKDTVCLEVSKTLYTNVGTVVLGQDGKPIPCTPKTK